MLEEMAAECITGTADGFIATGNPRAAFDDCVAIVISGRGEIIIKRMHVETVKRINRGFCPLPNIAKHIVPLTMTVVVDRARRGKMIQMDIGRGNDIFQHFFQTGLGK